MPVEPVGSSPVIQVAPVAPEAPPEAPPSLKRKAVAVGRAFQLTDKTRSGMRTVRKLRLEKLPLSAQPDLNEQIIQAAKPATPRQKPSAGLLRLSGYFPSKK